MQASARTCGRSAAPQHDPKCRLKSSQCTLIIPHRVIQLLYHSGSQRQGCASHKSTNKNKKSLRSEYLVRPSSIPPPPPPPFLSLPYLQESSLCCQPVRRKVRRTGRIFPERAERSFFDPEHSFVVVRRISRTRFAKQTFAHRRFPEITGKDNLTVFSYFGRVKSPEWRRQLRRADLRQF